MWSDFKIKKVKRRFQAGQHQSKQEDSTQIEAEAEDKTQKEEVTRKSIGMIY